MKNKFFKAIIIFTLTAALYGCGNNNAADIQADYQQMNENISNNEANPQTEDSLVKPSQDTTTIPSEYQNEFKGVLKNFIMTVDAKVISDGYPSSSVYSVNIKEIDEEYLKDLASKLFDNGEYKVVSPYFLMDPNEINIINEKYPNTVDYEKQVSKNFRKQDETQEFSEDQMFYDAYIEGYDLRELYYPTDAKSDHQSIARIEGKINGVAYELCCQKCDIEDCARLFLHCQELGRAFGRAYDIDDDSIPDIYGDNTISLDDARNIAEEYLEKIGKSDYKEMKVSKRLCAEEGDEGKQNHFDKYLLLDGYRFIYTPVIDDISVPACGNYSALMVDQDEANSLSQPLVMIDVDEYGLCCIKIMNDFEIKEQSSGNNNVLTFDQINEKIAEYVNNKDDVDFAKMETYAITYRYVFVKEGAETKLVPAWVYSFNRINGSEHNTESAEYEWIGVNAIDGSIIRFNETSSWAYMFYL